MKVFTFLFINFIVAFFSDIVLNDLTFFNFFPSLKPYFYKQSIIGSALAAAVTVEIAVIITMILFYLLTRSLIPTNYTSLLYFCILAFVIGYLIDIFIEKMKIFGNRLDAYYKKFGAGFWGATAFLFSILISYFIENKVLPVL